MSFRRTKHHYSANDSNAALDRQAPDLEILWGPVAYINHGRTQPVKETYADHISIGALLVRPHSRGTIKLQTASPFDAAIIDPNCASA